MIKGIGNKIFVGSWCVSDIDNDVLMRLISYIFSDLINLDVRKGVMKC